MAASKLQSWFPWVHSPVIANGPMIGVVCPRLAVEVTRAGGIGINACAVNLAAGSQNLKDLDANLAECRRLLGPDATDPLGRLRVGAGFVTGDPSIGSFHDNALPILRKHRPAAVWLFAPAESPTQHHSKIIAALREGIDPAPRVFVQVGNVAAAREALEDGADVLVCQGIDAGGHQFRRGMGVITLVPEVKEMIEESGRDVKIMAAGGIVSGKGAAAALALGADGIVMGTRFTVCDESIYPDFRKKLVLETRDGGSTTLKHHFNDEIQESALWGPLYDGRAIISVVHEEFLAGATTEVCLQRLKETYSPEDGKKLISTWAGTGVGMVKKAMPAGEIVKEVREEAITTIRGLSQSI